VNVAFGSTVDIIMRKCSKCKCSKYASEFFWKVKNKLLQSTCKSCSRERNRKHYQERKDRYKDRKKKYKIKAKEIVYEHLKDHPCVDCGEDNIIVLEFDHFRDKKYNISNLLNGRVGTPRIILEEIAKCEVRCANCHRKKTAIEQNWDILAWVGVDSDTHDCGS
jgi:hypothetical protein